MSENKSYRIKTVVGVDAPDYVGNLNVELQQEYDTFEILSLKISSSDIYRLHDSNCGVIAGRVIANNGFGIPNAKLSIFIEADSDEASDLRKVYPFTSTASKDYNGYTYNLLPDNKVDDCHQVVGSFPNKSYLLDNDLLLEVFDKYYKFTTRSNNSGDFMMVGVPVGNHTLHMDLDLSDCGVLSQRPRDFVYKGYTVEQFESPNQFKTSKNLSSLSQIFTQEQVVNVSPFWGNSSNGETIGITRCDINVAYHFEPTAVFMGSLVSDNSSNGISKNCIPTNRMGAMDELIAGEGSIEMIRKTPTGSVEVYTVKGNQQIDGNGVWCYQIPMNLDYVVTDEYGNMVPTDDPEKGIPTRARVRFRISMNDMDGNTDMYYRAKVLVPNNPSVDEEIDYDFGTNTDEESYRDLLWNNVYTIKSYIPRFGKSKRWKTERFTGIKGVNHAGYNNPIPYNNIRIKLPLMFTLLCILIKAYIWLIGLQNRIVIFMGTLMSGAQDVIHTLNVKIPNWKILPKRWRNRPFFPQLDSNEKSLIKRMENLAFTLLNEGMCPDLDGWYFAPVLGEKDDWIWVKTGKNGRGYKIHILESTFNKILEHDNTDEINDEMSIDYDNSTVHNNEYSDLSTFCLTRNVDYLIECIEMALAEEYRVINFDFYNDWINGLIYIPRWMRTIKTKRKYWVMGPKREKIRGCMDDPSIFGKSRRYLQLCTLQYGRTTENTYTELSNDRSVIKNQTFHKKEGNKYVKIFGKNGGIVHEAKTLVGQNVYYLKPCEKRGKLGKVNLFATDLVLLGSLNSCDINGTPNLFESLSITSYKMPTNLALTNMETDGALYGTQKGTMCSNREISEEGISPIGKTLKDEIRLLNTTAEGSNKPIGDTIDFDITGGADPSDTMPITEAAGISWNYAGPQQEISKKEAMGFKRKKNNNYNKTNLFFPGGHFLGLSCLNSQTNMKTCVNLSRICELGVGISQRHEKVRGISDDNKGNTTFKYTYNVPTGLIAHDEILSARERAIFATLNHKKLKVKRYNKETGYFMYDFSYLYPDGFNGEFENIFKISTINNEYNKDIKGASKEDRDLSEFGVELEKYRSDYDPEESKNTQMQTIESLNKDYYKFRLGLNSADLRNGKAKNKYLASQKNRYYLPQYENSFYFYFGLKGGATALDEFNKQFYSTCSSDSIVTNSVDHLKMKKEFDHCSGLYKVTISFKGLEPQININTFVQNIPSEEDEINTSTWEPYEGRLANYYDNDGAIIYFELNKTFKIIVDDANDNTFEEVINTTPDFVDIDYTVSHYNAAKASYAKEWQEGGYVEINNLSIQGLDSDIAPYIALVKDGSLAQYEKYENGKPLYLYGNGGGRYTIFVKYTNNGDGCREQVIPVITLNITEPQNVPLWMGNMNDSKDEHPSNIDLTTDLGNKTYTEWWNNLSSFEPIIEWKLKHFITQQNGLTESDEVFNSYVHVDGDKYLFGVPQDDNGYHSSNTIYSSRDYETPDGYYVTDSSQTFKTYAYNGNTISAMTKGKVYGAVGTNNAATTPYCGWISGNTNLNGMSTYTINVTNASAINSINGYGAIAKSDSGEFEVVNVRDGKAIFNDAKYEPYRGVIFPIIKYPSIWRPTYVDATFIAMDSVDVAQDYTTGEVEETILNEERMIAYTGAVHNPIMIRARRNNQNRYFLSDLNIDNKRISYNPPTTNNIFDTQVLTFSGTFKDSEMPDVAYNNVYAVEGIPLNGETPVAEYLPYAYTASSPDVEQSAYSNLYYYRNSGYYSSNKCEFYSDSEETSNIEYYIVNCNVEYNNNGNRIAPLFTSRTWVASGITVGDKEYYVVLGRVTRGENKGEYTPLLVRNDSKEMLVPDYENVSSDSDRLVISLSNYSLQEDTNLGILNDRLSTNNINIEALLYKIPSSNIDKYRKIEELIRSGKATKIVVNGGASESYTFSPGSYIVVGFSESEESDRLGKASYMKLYPYIQYVKSRGEVKTYVSVTPDTLTFGGAGGSKIANVTSNTTWTVKVDEDDKDWLKVDTEEGVGKQIISITTEELVDD